MVYAAGVGGLLAVTGMLAAAGSLAGMAVEDGGKAAQAVSITAKTQLHHKRITDITIILYRFERQASSMLETFDDYSLSFATGD